MHRAVPIAALIATAALAAAGGAPAQAATSSPVLSAELKTCASGALPEQRVTAFAGAMPARSGASRMAMRFDLQRRSDGAGVWSRIVAAGFGTWERSLPDRAGFIFHKRIVGLAVPASYRAVVRFRWMGANGRILARARRTTAPCVQPDLRPDLVPGGLTAVLSVQPVIAVYTLVVRNSGRSASAPFTVRVGSGRAAAGALAVGEQRGIVVLATACAPGSTVLVRVDDDRMIDESDEQANGQRLPCPLAGAA